MTPALPLPPQPSGQVGLRALQALIRHRNILAALELLHAEMGDIFRIAVPNFNPVVMVGPQANRFLLVTQRDKLRWRPEGDPVAELLRHGLLVEDEAAHDTLRAQMDPALHREMLVQYIETMAACTGQITARWQTGNIYDMLVEMRKIALLILMQTLFGVDFSPHLERLWGAVLRLLRYISPGLWLVWRGVPQPGYRQARQQMDDYLYQIIQARRAAPDPSGDLLGRLVATPGLSDGLIRDQLLTMLIAGHDTSTALLAWSLYLLGQHPAAMRQAQTEVDTVLAGQSPTFQQVKALKYLDKLVKESLRLYPPIHAGMRRAAVDLEFQGYRIPAGRRVMYSIYLSHRHPAYWPQPARFDPERFDPAQNRSRPAFSYVPFGGGPRNCIGAAFGLVEAKVVLARLLQQFSLTLVSDKVHPHMGATLEPRPGVLMRVRRRS